MADLSFFLLDAVGKMQTQKVAGAFYLVWWPYCWCVHKAVQVHDIWFYSTRVHLFLAVHVTHGLHNKSITKASSANVVFVQPSLLPWIHCVQLYSTCTYFNNAPLVDHLDHGTDTIACLPCKMAMIMSLEKMSSSNWIFLLLNLDSHIYIIIFRCTQDVVNYSYPRWTVIYLAPFRMTVVSWLWLANASTKVGSLALIGASISRMSNPDQWGERFGKRYCCVRISKLLGATTL